MPPLLLFLKAYVPEHTRRLKNGNIITVAAYYDKRIKKAAKHAPDHTHDVSHLSDEDKVKFANMHKEQHVSHYYEAHAIKRKLDAEHQLRDTLKRSLERYKESGDTKSWTITKRKLEALEARMVIHQKHLARAEKISKGIGEMKEGLVKDSGTLTDDADQAHAQYVSKLGERFRENGARFKKEDLIPASHEENIARGKEAMKKVVSDHIDVNHAMYRKELGWIDFPYGNEGESPNAKGKRKGAKGVAHILDARRRKDGMDYQQAINLLDEIVVCIDKGDHTESRYQDTKRNIEGTKSVVNYNGIEVILMKDDGSDAWLMTGYEKNKHPSVVSGEGGGNTGTTLAGSTPPRPSKGAEGSESIVPSMKNTSTTIHITKDGEMKEGLVKDSGTLTDDADQAHAQYVEKMGERFKKRNQAVRESATHEEITEFVTDILSGRQPKVQRIIINVASQEKTDKVLNMTHLDIGEARELVVPSAAVHIKNKHPDIDIKEWLYLPELAKNFDVAIESQTRGVNKELPRLIFIKNKDDKAYVYIADLATGKRQGNRLTLVTYFKDKPENLLPSLIRNGVKQKDAENVLNALFFSDKKSPLSQAYPQRTDNQREELQPSNSAPDASIAPPDKKASATRLDDPVGSTRELPDENHRRFSPESSSSGQSIAPTSEKSSYTYAKLSTIDTPAQGALNGAREGKKTALKRVAELRERLKNEPLNGNRTGLRLELIRAQDRLHEAKQAERDALEAIETRANQLGLTTIKPKSLHKALSLSPKPLLLIFKKVA